MDCNSGCCRQQCCPVHWKHHGQQRIVMLRKVNVCTSAPHQCPFLPSFYILFLHNFSPLCILYFNIFSPPSILYCVPQLKEALKKLYFLRNKSFYTNQVPPSTSYNSSFRRAQFSQLNNFTFYNSFDESRTVYLSSFHMFSPQWCSGAARGGGGDRVRCWRPCWGLELTLTLW